MAKFPPPKVSGYTHEASTDPKGATFTITGTGFDAVEGVEACGVACKVNGKVEATKIICFAAGVEDADAGKCVPGVVVTQASGVAKFPPPKVTCVSPAAGTPSGSTELRITGTGFETDKKDSTTVTVCDVNCPIVEGVDKFTANLIVCTTGAKADATDAPCDVVVKWDSKAKVVEGGKEMFTYKTPTAKATTIICVSPATGSPLGGDELRITGTGFETNKKSSTTVKVCGEDCPIVGDITANLIVCTTPAKKGNSDDPCDVVVKWDSNAEVVEGGNTKFTYE